jgi:hypothetical protein
MADIRWTGGSLEAAIQQVVFPQVRDNIAARLRAVRCPEHRTGPTSVTVSGHSIDLVTWEVRGCCSKLVEAAKRAFD